jgi:hypothetical protein
MAANIASLQPPVYPSIDIDSPHSVAYQYNCEASLRLIMAAHTVLHINIPFNVPLDWQWRRAKCFIHYHVNCWTDIFRPQLVTFRHSAHSTALKHSAALHVSTYCTLTDHRFYTIERCYLQFHFLSPCISPKPLLSYMRRYKWAS